MLIKTWRTSDRKSAGSCPRCSEMNGQTALINQPYRNPRTGEIVEGPPLHPHCDCINEYSNDPPRITSIGGGR